jgi:hypothetical protein
MVLLNRHGQTPLLCTAGLGLAHPRVVRTVASFCCAAIGIASPITRMEAMNSARLIGYPPLDIFI